LIAKFAVVAPERLPDRRQIGQQQQLRFGVA
jgi:hypothetical protein